MTNLHDEKIDIVDLHRKTGNNDFTRVYERTDEQEKQKQKLQHKYRYAKRIPKTILDEMYKEDTSCIKGILALYRVSKTGKMQRIDEVDL